MRARLPPGGGVWRFFGGADPSPVAPVVARHFNRVRARLTFQIVFVDEKKSHDTMRIDSLRCPLVKLVLQKWQK